MFNKLRSTLSSFINRIGIGGLREREILENIENFKFSLLETDVSYDIAEEISNRIIEKLRETKIRNDKELRKYVIKILAEEFYNILKHSYDPSFEEKILELKKNKKIIIMVFLGVNGVGKTTTIAKLAYRLKKKGFRPVLSASDTYRAGAQEQLEYHAKRIRVPIIKHKYGADPASVAYDTVMYAKARGFDVVMVDTAGRMHTDIDLMEELSKIVRVVKPDYRILVVDSLTGHDAVEQALTFEKGVGVDAIILTKIDADVKGGIALTLAQTIPKPIIYVGVGQRYEDLIPFDPSIVVRGILEEI